MADLESEMFDYAIKLAAECTGVAAFNARINSNRRDWQVASILFALGTTGMCYEYFGKIDRNTAINFYQKVADFVAVDLLGVRRKSILITTPEWRRVKNKLLSVLTFILDAWGVVPSHPSELASHVKFLEAEIASVAEYGGDDADKTHVSCFAQSCPMCLQFYNSIANDEPLMRPLHRDEFYIITVLIAQIYSNVHDSLVVPR
jgi:hypothetical protein